MKKNLLLVFSILILTAIGGGQTASKKVSTDALSWNPPKTWVYFVGLLDWQDKEQFGSFPQKNRRDAILLDVLRQKGVPENQIVYLKDEQATIAKVKESFPKFLQKAREGDTIIVYFCGHGYKSADNEKTFLATYDVGENTEGWRTDTIPAAIEKYFKGAKAMIMADNCFSGALAEDVKALPNPHVGFAVMTSALADSTSTANWTFTESLIYAFRGDGYVDLNRDGKITFAELEKNAENNMQFGEKQAAAFEFSENFDKQGVVSISDQKTGSRIGERVEAYSVDGWYKGFIRDEKDGKFLVRYYGYEESDDEWVTAKQIRKSISNRFSKDSKVEVNWKGTWYPAKILEKRNNKYFIHYEGYDNSWDEWVTIARIRRIH